MPLRRRELLSRGAALFSVGFVGPELLTAMTRAYFGAKFLGYNFKMVAIPDNVNIGKDPLAFDPKQMRAAFDAGRAIAKNPNHWVSLPPNTGDVPSWAFEQIK